jgi:hypothetical protein
MASEATSAFAGASGNYEGVEEDKDNETSFSEG